LIDVLGFRGVLPVAADEELQRVLDAITLPSAAELAEMIACAAHPAPVPPGWPRCEACNRPLPPPGRRGPRRRFCNSACRMRVYRANTARRPA
jgi:hypothetical protein